MRFRMRMGMMMMMNNLIIKKKDTLHMVSRKTSNVVFVEMGVLLLQDYVHVLSNQLPEVYESSMGVSKMEEFWDQCKPHDPRFAGLKWVIEQQGWKKKYLPFYLHGFSVHEKLLSMWRT